MINLAFIKKYATLINWGGIILLVLGVLYAVYDYSQSKERLEQMEAGRAVLENRIQNIKSEVEEQNRRVSQIRSQYRQIELQYSRQVEQINELRGLTQEYISNNRPEIEKELNSKFNEITRSIQCASGDSSKCE